MSDRRCEEKKKVDGGSDASYCSSSQRERGRESSPGNLGRHVYFIKAPHSSPRLDRPVTKSHLKHTRIAIPVAPLYLHQTMYVRGRLRQFPPTTQQHIVRVGPSSFLKSAIGPLYQYSVANQNPRIGIRDGNTTKTQVQGSNGDSAVTMSY